MQYTYVDVNTTVYKNGEWHQDTVLVCESDSLSDADKKFAEQKGKDPAKMKNVAVIIGTRN